MTVKSVCKHCLDNIKNEFVEVKGNVKASLVNFKDSTAEQKAWILFKTFCVAVACAIITTVAGLLMGPGAAVALGLASIGVTAYAFYKFSQPPNAELDKLVQQGLRSVQQSMGQVQQMYDSFVDADNS
jgi:hypothetical protein